MKTKQSLAPLNTAEKPCAACLRLYRHPWGWLAIWPARILVDLCPRCAREIRYGTESEQRAVADAVFARLDLEAEEVRAA
jgi:hypothetical protein